MFVDYTTLPTCNSDQNANGDRPEADLLEIVMGLRAMVKGDLPATKPACPTAVTEKLPRHTREDALRQETANYDHGRYAKWAKQLAEAELSWFNDYELRRKAEGHTEDTFLQVDEQLDADNSWMDALAYDELVSWLRLEAKLTDKEVEALELRATGVPVPDRHCLKRAQTKAQAAM